jgi:hypothetical protein
MSILELLARIAEHLRENESETALSLLRDNLHMEDVRLYLEYARLLLGKELYFEALKLLQDNKEKYERNPYYLYMLSLAAEGVAKKAHGISVGAVDEALDHSVEQTQLEWYLAEALRIGLPGSPKARELLRTFVPDDIRASAEEASVRPIRFSPPAYARGTSFAVIPPATLIYEKPTAILPSIAKHIRLDTNNYEFEELSDVTLYMLPKMDGLIERNDGSLVGKGIGGGVNPHGNPFARVFGKNLYLHKEKIRDTWGTPVELPGKHLLPFRLAGTYYYHFIHETMTAARRALSSSSDFAVILPGYPSFFSRIEQSVYDDACNFFVGKSPNMMLLPEGVYKVERLLVPSTWIYGDHILADFVEVALPLNVKRHNARDIYVTRRNAPNRRLLNENELLDGLRAYLPSLELVELESLPFLDQINLFRESRIIIAPHGGGLTNLLFCREGTKIVEIHTNGATPAFWHTSFLRKLDYCAYIPIKNPHYNDNFTIQIPEFLEGTRAFLRG